MRKPSRLMVPLIVALLAAMLLTTTASAWNLGITYQETCEGYGITVNPATHYSGSYKYVPFETQVNNGGGWNPVPYSDFSGDLNPWNPSGQHNYEVKIHYRVYRWIMGFWILQPHIHTEGPFHHRVEKPDDCYEVCSETIETGPVDTILPWSEWVYNPSTGMEERSRTIVHTYTIVDARDGKTVCGTREVLEVQTETRWPKADFNLTSMCRLADGSGQLRIRNNSLIPQAFHLYKVGGGFDLTGTAPVGDTLYTVPYTSSSDTYILEIAGWSFTKAIGHNDYCEAQHKLTSNDCVGWEVTEYNSPEDQGTVVGQGYWTDPFVLEEADSHGFHIEEPKECQIPHEGLVDLTNDCGGWRVFYVLDGEEVTVAGGAWTDPYLLEAAEFGAFDIPVDEGEEIEISDPLGLTAGGVVSEPADCYVCKITDAYRMIAYVDYDAPEWYWGQGARNGSCWIKLPKDDTSPGVAIERQAEICSVCAHPDFVYEADDILYDGMVGVDCRGNIVYPDPLWNPEWFDPKFPEVCRQPSCLDPEVKP